MFNSRKIPRGQKVLVSRRGNAFQAADYMSKVVQSSIKEPRLIEFVKNNPMNEREIFETVFQSVLFEPDKKNKQVIKTPLATLRMGRGNCVDYSVLIATLMKLNGIKGFFRMVKFEEKGFPKHIFVVSEKGKILDCSIGQNQDGEQTLQGRKNKNGFFNKELKYLFKFDKSF